MRRNTLPWLLALWFSGWLGISQCIASPSFRFTKASSPQNEAPVSNNATHTLQDVQRLCPLTFNPNDVSMERQLKHQVNLMKDQKIVSYPRITIPIVLHVVQSSGKLLVKDGYISPKQFSQQMAILNQDFAKANINFRSKA
ncbi:hypothetical protein BKA70DRAFT_1296051 [Coprinopsis sp. MPI-PUGE-AT-0042]|nr:hypothetical protein BKA70DRAFT_1296051 [Coprinopsis sp. MPI-PUGE-AT-0042]